MNTFGLWLRKVVPTIAILAMVAGLAAFRAPATVYASSGLEETPPPTQSAPDPARLEKAYQKLQELLGKQEERLGKVDGQIAKVVERIATLKEAGKDVSALEEALANYQVKVAQANTLHGEAAAILEAHNGFDIHGKVIDANTAKETLKGAAEKMRAAHRELAPAMRELLKTLREYRRENRPIPTP
jgi:hypothetical protein